MCQTWMSSDKADRYRVILLRRNWNSFRYIVRNPACKGQQDHTIAPQLSDSHSLSSALRG